MADTSQNPDRRGLLKEALRALDEMQAKLHAAERAARSGTEPIAVIGMGCRFPGGADSPEAFWQLLRTGTDAITEVPPERWGVDRYFALDPDLAASRPRFHGGFVRDVACFDADFFGISPREALSMDPQHRLALEVCWEALEHAGYAPRALAGSETGVFVGITASDYWQHLRSADPTRLDVYIATGNSHNAAAGRVSFALGLQGPAMAVDTACSSSLTAVHLACQSLRLGESRMALAGGVNTMHNPDSFFAFHKWGFMAVDGRCKTFDAAADGFVRGEGCGFVVLKRLSDALADGDTVLAVVRGSAVNQDGATSGFTVPNGRAQEAVIRQALQRSGVAPADVGYVEAHGTGTALGDPIELEALETVLSDARPGDRPLVVGSVKTNVGHLESAAGVAGLIKVVLALQHEEIPPHLHFKVLNPKASIGKAPLLVPTTVQRWAAGDRPRIAGVSSFGISGTNAHLVVEEAPAVQPHATDAARRAHVLTLSAANSDRLRVLAGRWAACLEANPSLSIGDVAYTANAGRTHLSHRAAIVAASLLDAHDELASLAAGSDSRAVRGVKPAAGEDLRVAFVFSGTAAQLGAGRELYLSQPVFREALDRCAGLLRGELDVPLLDLLYPAANATSPIAEPRYALPALVAVDYALAELWRSWGVAPSVVLGHGAAEYAAACMAGVFSLADALKLAAARGRRVHAEAVPHSGAATATDDFDRVVHAMTFARPRVAVISGATGRRAMPDEIASPSYWREALTAAQPAPRSEALAGEATTVVEIGPEQGWRTLLETAAALYVGGLDLQWKAIDAGYPRRKVALPTYPFQRDRFWVDAKPATAARQEDDCFYEIAWRRKPLASDADLPAAVLTSPWIVLCDRQGVGHAVAGAREARGGRCIEVPAGSDCVRAVKAAAASSGSIAGLVHLWSLDAPGAAEMTVDDLADAQAAGAESLVRAAQALLVLPGAVRPRLFAVTSGIAPAMVAAEASIAQAPMWGAGRVIALEHPEVWGALIDLEPAPAADLAHRILAEISAGSAGEEIAYRHGVRHVARLTRSVLDAHTSSALRQDATYLITGGTGGLGLALAGWMADRGAQHIVLTSRKGQPTERAALATLDALAGRGIDVRVVAADAADRDHMASLVRELQRGASPLRGVVHAAGVLRNGDVRELTVEAMRDLGRPKVTGAWILHELTRELPLDFFVVFSSGASVWGSRGLASYGAANGFLDALAHYRRANGLPATSINWGPWAAGMASAGDQRVMAQMGITAFSPDEGVRALERVLTAGPAQIVAAKVDWSVFEPIYTAKSDRRLLEELRTRPAAAKQPPVDGGALAREVTAALPGERLDVLIAALQRHAAVVLGVDGGLPNPQRGLTELGMDSLMAVELRDRLQHAIGRSLPPTLAFDSPTLAAMAEFLLSTLAPPSAAPAPPASSDPDVADVEPLSDEEVKALLAGELAALSLDGFGEGNA
jgi:acyl transferase domain-containing protein/acyl carrier protein